MKKLPILLLMLLVVPLISAQTYKQNQELDFKVPFEVNGSIPSSDANCNISIKYPDGSYLKRNASMTNLNNGDFNITLSEYNVSKIGEYEWIAFCCDGGSQCASGYSSFEITPSGFGDLTSGQALTLFLSIGVILIMAILFFIFSFKVISFPAKVIFMGLSLVLFVVVIIFSMISISQVLGGWTTFVESYTSFLWVSLFLFLIVVLFLFLVLMKHAIELFKIKKGLR